MTIRTMKFSSQIFTPRIDLLPVIQFLVRISFINRVILVEYKLDRYVCRFLIMAIGIRECLFG